MATLWTDCADQQGRVVVSVDKKTLAVDAWDRVARGLPMPRVAILRILLTIGDATARMISYTLTDQFEPVYNNGARVFAATRPASKGG